jgi:hypothetical protein
MQLQRAIYETRGQKVRHFFLGFFLTILMNAILIGIITLVGSLPLTNTNLSSSNALSSLVSILAPLVSCVAFLLNIGLMIFFGFTRYWIAIGMLSLFALLFALGLIAGIVLGVACLIALSNQ